MIKLERPRQRWWWWQMGHFWILSLFWRLLAALRVLILHSLNDYVLSSSSHLAQGYTGYRDSANNPWCSLRSSRPITQTSTVRTPALIPTSPRPTSTRPDHGHSGSDSLNQFGLAPFIVFIVVWSVSFWPMPSENVSSISYPIHCVLLTNDNTLLSRIPSGGKTRTLTHPFLQTIWKLSSART